MHMCFDSRFRFTKFTTIHHVHQCITILHIHPHRCVHLTIHLHTLRRIMQTFYRRIYMPIVLFSLIGNNFFLLIQSHIFIYDYSLFTGFLHAVCFFIFNMSGRPTSFFPHEAPPPSFSKRLCITPLALTSLCLDLSAISHILYRSILLWTTTNPYFILQKMRLHPPWRIHGAPFMSIIILDLGPHYPGYRSYMSITQSVCGFSWPYLLGQRACAALR